MSGLKATIQQALGGGSGGGGGSNGKMKFTNIVEQVDVGVPVRVAYNQWTEFQDFPSIMKKVEHADGESDNRSEQKLSWKAQVLWSHRSWDATVIEQIADQHIVWRSIAQKGHVDGAVTFHELAPALTHILVILEYHQQGFVEGTANLWRAAGRRARLELKHFARHVMTQTILNSDDVEGWRGEIHDGEVVKTHEQVVKEEQDLAEEVPPDEDANSDGEEPTSTNRTKSASPATATSTAKRSHANPRRSTWTQGRRPNASLDEAGLYHCLSRLTQELTEARQQAAEAMVVLDLRALGFCDSSGLGVFINAHQQAEVAGGNSLSRACPTDLPTG